MLLNTWRSSVEDDPAAIEVFRERIARCADGEPGLVAVVAVLTVLDHVRDRNEEPGVVSEILCEHEFPLEERRSLLNVNRGHTA